MNPNLDEALHLIYQATAMQAASADQLARAATLLRNILIHGNGMHAPTGILHHNGDRPLFDQDSLAVHWDGRNLQDWWHDTFAAIGATLPASWVFCPHG